MADVGRHLHARLDLVSCPASRWTLGARHRAAVGVRRPSCRRRARAGRIPAAARAGRRVRAGRVAVALVAVVHDARSAGPGVAHPAVGLAGGPGGGAVVHRAAPSSARTGIVACWFGSPPALPAARGRWRQLPAMPPLHLGAGRLRSVWLPPALLALRPFLTGPARFWLGGGAGLLTHAMAPQRPGHFRVNADLPVQSSPSWAQRSRAVSGRHILTGLAGTWPRHGL